MKTSTLLLKAAKLIDTPEKWYQGEYTSPCGTKRCALGALIAAGGTTFDGTLNAAVSPFQIWEFNDDPNTTHGDVMMAFAMAIQLAKDAGD